MSKKFLFVMVLMVFAMTAFAQTEERTKAEDEDLKKIYFYQWTDDRGSVHIADGWGKVPKQYRTRAVKLEQTKSGNADQGQQEQNQEQEQEQAESVLPSDSDAADEAAKAEWRQRIQETKALLKNGEKRYKKLDKERTELLGVMGPAAMAPIANRVRAEEIAAEMKTVKKEIEDAQHMLEVVIPEEARKAGVPPGWLRE